MSCFLVSYISILVLLPHLIICQKEHQYTFRVTNVVNCNMTGLKLFIDGISTYYHFPKTYANIRYRAIEVLKRLTRLYLHIERCNKERYDCEDFQNWKIDNLCRIMAWGNQFWSSITENCQPPLRCPLKKAIYEVQNASIDIAALMDWFPDMFKYHWKLHGKIMNEHGDIIHCSFVEGSMAQVKVQNRKPYGNRGT